MFDGNIKRYETHDQLNLNQDEVNGMEEVFVEESGINYANQTKSGINRKNYFYTSSKVHQNSEDPYENPLDKRLNNGTLPIGSTIKKGEESSEAILFVNNSG